MEAKGTSRVRTDNSTPGGSPVYYTDDVSAAGLLAAYKALGFTPSGKVAVKLHMGEEGNSNYPDPELLRPLVEEVGGTFKNLAIWLATVPQKRIVHGPSFDTGAVFLERVVDVAKAVFDNLGDRMACVNVLNNLSLDCDCDGSAGAPLMADIGIMASLDPVALDRASLDQLYLSDDPGRDAMISRIESYDGAYLLLPGQGRW